MKVPSPLIEMPPSNQLDAGDSHVQKIYFQWLHCFILEHHPPIVVTRAHAT